MGGYPQPCKITVGFEIGGVSSGTHTMGGVVFEKGYLKIWKFGVECYTFGGWVGY
tara:strand:- start:375 stop:539 length:165 start_codon:yes stop_codon:yes gene_type:complete